MDYYEIAQSMADTLDKAGAPLSADQRILLVGVISPWLDKRDQRIEQLTRALKSAAVVLKLEMQDRSKFNVAAADALMEADRALSITG